MKPVPLTEAVALATAWTSLVLLVLATLAVAAYACYEAVRFVFFLRGKTLPYFSDAVSDLLSFEWPFKGDSHES